MKRKRRKCRKKKELKGFSKIKQNVPTIEETMFIRVTI
jgi:hypothetical protein